MVGFVNAGKRLSERLLNLADKTAKTAFTFPRVIEDGYTLSSAETGFIRGSDETWVYEQVRSAIHVFADLARAVEISSTIGAVVSYLLFVATSLSFLANFRATTIRARQGKFVEELNRHKVKIEAASEYTGTHVSVTIVNYYFSCAVFTLLMFPLCSENLWEYIAYFISANYGWILSTMLPVALNIAAKEFSSGRCFSTRRIRRFGTERSGRFGNFTTYSSVFSLDWRRASVDFLSPSPLPSWPSRESISFRYPRG